MAANTRLRSLEDLYDLGWWAAGPAVSYLYRLKENYILLSTDGPGRNVLKFKPPMCFSLDNARHVVAKLDAILTGEPGGQGAADNALESSLESQPPSMPRDRGLIAEPDVF